MSILFFIISTIISGFFGTLFMTFFLWTVSSVKIANVNLINSIGSSVTGSEDNALIPGLFLHFFSGILFAFVYCFIFEAIPRTELYLLSYTLIGFFIGLVHGIIFSLVLSVSLVRKHPVKKFQKSGFLTLVFYFLGHIIYGLGTGFFYTLGRNLFLN